ncbi:MAG: hypothetical protein Q8K43_10425 [Sulfurimicrobium sp.]|nr:hypothetical protein [Gallionella sp.]MDP1898290.1 hypothetical protein [Sulfurimicrobium sp.]
MIPLFYRVLGGLVMMLAVFAAGLWAGKDYAKKKCVAGQVAAQGAAIIATAKEDTRRETIGTQRETSGERIRIVYKNLKEQADEIVKNNPEFNDCGLDADGLRLWNAANSGSAAPVPGEPEFTLYHTATGQVGEADRLVAEPHRGDGMVQPVPGQAGQVGGVRK